MDQFKKKSSSSHDSRLFHSILPLCGLTSKYFLGWRNGRSKGIWGFRVIRGGGGEGAHRQTMTPWLNLVSYFVLLKPSQTHLLTYCQRPLSRQRLSCVAAGSDLKYLKKPNIFPIWLFGKRFEALNLFSSPPGERSPCLARPCSQGLKLTALFGRDERWQLLSFSLAAHMSTPCSRNKVQQALDFSFRFSNQQIHSPSGAAAPVLSRKIWGCSQE